MKRNILLCVAGTTPQIITETLFDLIVQQGKHIDEIRVITTLEGRNKIKSNLLDEETGKFYAFCKDFEVDPNLIKFDETCISLLRKRDGQMLEDIRTVEENELAGNQICEIVRELCKDENTHIYASAAGGRKTMSIYLTLAMSLFGRSKDTLSHVLISQDFETNKQFYYPPPNPIEIDSYNPITKKTKRVSTKDAEIFLAPIRFIRLRGISRENEEFGKARTYNEMVDEAQKVLDISEKEYDLFIDIKKQSVFIKGQKIKLTPREFFFYYIFIKKKLDGKDVFSIHELKDTDFHDALKKILLITISEDVDWQEISEFPKYNFADSMLQKLEDSRNPDKINSLRDLNFEDFRDEFSTVVNRIKNKFKKNGVDDRYYLVTTDDGTASYQLKISANRLIFVE